MRAFLMMACLSTLFIAGCGGDNPKPAANDDNAPTKEATAEPAPKAPETTDKKE